MLKGVKLKIPKIGIVICNSGASNTGTLTGLAAFDVVKKNIGICSLPALAVTMNVQRR